MKKQKNKAYLGRWLFVLLSALSFSLQGQDPSNTHYYDEDHQRINITVPEGYSYLYLEANGGDGGRATGQKQDAGEGAWVSAYVKIGTGTGQLPPGSAVRLIPGQVGKAAKYCAGGGGGSAVAFKKANAPWSLVLVAGGGGGAGADDPGRRASARTQGLGGIADDTYDEALNNGGVDGNGGSYDNDSGHAGGGAFSAGKPYDCTYCVGQAGYQNGRPSGGIGGYHNDDKGRQGGFGFGGGGSGRIFPEVTESVGGGGGGYSGGGGGKFGGGGGGGGSYVNPDWAWIEVKKSFDITTWPKNGYVYYQFTNSSPVKAVQLAKTQADTQDDKCFDLAGGKTVNGTNIQIYKCNDTPSQQWVLERNTIRLKKEIEKCLDVDHSQTANGTNIQLWDCNRSDAQNWIYDVDKQALRSAIDINKCLDVYHGGTADGTNVQLYDCNDSKAQQWLINDLSLALPDKADIHLIAAPDKCVDVYQSTLDGFDNGTNIQLGKCNGTDSQFFTFRDGQVKLYAAQELPGKCVDIDPNGIEETVLEYASVYNHKVPVTKITHYNVRLWECNDQDNQQWIYDGISRAFRSKKHSDMCLSVEHGNFDEGTSIQVWGCTGRNAQRFSVEGVDPCIDDHTPPIAKCKDFQNNGNIIPQAANFDAGSYDDCAISSMRVVSLGANRYNLIVTDPSGNKSSCEAKTY